nr:reverse transcriptase domain-containing protein [Tanacetum cinerariifolium]
MAKKGETSEKDKVMEILMVQPWKRVAVQRITQRFSPDLEISFPPLWEEDRTKGPMIIEAEIRGHFIHRIYVYKGSASKILYEHYFNRLCPEVKNQMVSTTAPLIGFSGEVIWPMGQILLPVKIGDGEHSTSTWMNFVVMRSPSSYNGIIRRPREAEERIKVAIHPEYPKQTIAIVTTLTEEGRKALCDLPRRNLDIFAWKPTDITGVAGRLQKWNIKLGEYDIQFRPRTSVKGKILADFIVKRLEDDSLDTPTEAEEEIPALFDATINEAGYEAVYKASITGLRITKQMEETLLAKKEKARAIRCKSGWDNPFKDWCEKLCIRQRFASVKHPEANGLVERANRSLGEGIKARLYKRRKDWIKEILHVLWAHRTMIKSSNGDTPFLLTYGTKAVIPIEIGMPTLWTAEIDMVQNDEAMEINLDLLEERREKAAIREARSKEKMEKYYNSKVRNTSFKLGDLVYRNNDASHAKDSRKLSPK